MRGTAKALGKNYTKKMIANRIEKKKERVTSYTPKDKALRSLIDTMNDPKFTDSPGLQRWAMKENLKIAAKTYSMMTATKLPKIKTAFLESMNHQIILFGGAGRMLQRKSILPDAVNVAKLKAEYGAVLADEAGTVQRKNTTGAIGMIASCGAYTYCNIIRF